MRAPIASLTLFLVACSVCSTLTASAQTRVYRLSDDTQLTADIERTAVLRELPGMRLLLRPVEEPRLHLDGLREIRIRPSEELYLVDLGPDATLDVLALESRVLEVTDHFAVIAIESAHARRLDRLGVRKERLAWVPRVERQAGPPAIRQLSKVSAQTKLDIVNAVSQSRFSQINRELSGDLVFWLNGNLTSNDNRYTLTAGSGSDIDVAADYLEDRFQAAGYPVIRQSFNVGATATDNIIAVKTGTVYPDSVVVVGAHYDSTSEIPTTTAPGAEDNGSGTASVLHLAEIFSTYSTERTIHFVCFSGEEQGLFGSQYYVSQLGANGWNVTQSIIMDMIATWETNYKVIIEGQPAWLGLMDNFRDNVVTYSQIGWRQDLFSFGSDHVPFQNAGIPCFLAIDWDYDAYNQYHRSTDEWAFTDPTLGVRITKAVGATLADLANPTSTGTPAPSAPNALRLAQNLPNPFNPSTRISYSIASEGRVLLEVFDLAGRRVTTLVDATQSAGPHAADWNGRDSAGRNVASGLYLYRLSHADGSLSRRMVLAK
jgi:Peptidase family M28/FlgD Ig-like domain